MAAKKSPEEKVTRPRGRPPTKVHPEEEYKPETKYDPAFCDTLYNDMADNGATEAAFCKRAEISWRTFNEWMVEHPEFQEARDRGHVAAEAYWVEWATNMMTGEGHGNKARAVPLFWQSIMTNRFGWGAGGKAVTGAGQRGPSSDNSASKKTDKDIAAELQRIIDASNADAGKEEEQS